MSAYQHLMKGVCEMAEIETKPAAEVELLRDALEAMLDLITSGRHYQTQNPYTRPEVEQTYQALGRDWRTES